MKKLILLVAWLTVESSAQKFILSKPQVLQTDHFKQSEEEGWLAATTPSRHYELPPPLTTPSTFYQVPGVVTVVSDPPSPPPPSPTQASQLAVTEGSLTNTVLSRPGAITAAESEKLLISGGATAALAIVASQSDTKLTSSSSSLSAGTALLISFLLSLIPTLAVSIPFIAFRRRVVTQGRSAQFSLDDLLYNLHRVLTV